MAAKGIAYKDMNAKQKKLAEKISRRYGMPVEKVSMTKLTGMIIVNQEDCPHLSSVDWALVREGLHYNEITDAHRKEYIEQWERDRPGDKALEEAKAGLAARRGR